jgi:hypothetical protein
MYRTKGGENMLFEKLDRERLGEMVLRLPLSSHHLDHKKVQYTVKDYIIPEKGDLEGQFIRDLFTLSTEEMIHIWFDGSDNANELIMKLSAR